MNSTIIKETTSKSEEELIMEKKTKNRSKWAPVEVVKSLD